jgi:hypothetical protein
MSWLLVFAIFAFSLQGEGAGNCSVETLDVRNVTLRTAGRTFAFRDGVAYGFELPPEARKREKAELGSEVQPDFEARIEQDEVLRPAPGVAVRLFLIHDSHLTGSGWRYYATAVRCGNGKLVEVFHEDGLTLKVEVQGQQIRTSRLSSGRRLWRSYWWNAADSRYVQATEPSRVRGSEPQR